MLTIAAAVPVAVTARDDATGRDHPRQANPTQLQRVLGELTSGPDRIAPGATGYVAGPHGVLLAAAGIADVASGTPMPPDAWMRLESVSKIWTAVLVLQLAEQGRLDVEDTVARWLPGLLPFGDRITLRQLLTHTRVAMP